jgi:succinate-semialdehyde dehydrogenase/glutarate-semialdehyde dehydrogenase
MDIQERFETRFFVGGSWRSAPRTFAVKSPIDDRVLAEIADCGAAEARAAADAAVEAFDKWRRTTAYERAAIMRRWHDLMMRDLETIARTITLEMGKPITEARGEVRYAAGFVEWYVEEAKRIYGQTIPSQFSHKRLFALPQPVGPVYGVTPWNFPAAMVTRKAAPALAAGCTFIHKPAEQSPLTALLLGRLWEEAGGPPGTLQVLPALDPIPITEVMMADARIRKIAFTGSTDVGRLLYRQATDTLKRVSLELGGHAPFIIFDDADVEKAVAAAMGAKFRAVGQTCISANRFYVYPKVIRDFSEAYAEAARKLKVGNPLQDETQIGPLVDQQALDKVTAHVKDALARGAKLVLGGKSERLIYQPTVLLNVDPQSRMLHEETFGPVAPIIPCQDDTEAVRVANATPYGLAAYFWTRDLTRVFTVAEQLEYGIIGVNDGTPSTPQAPFGGVKNSGIGREGGHWGIEEYLEIKYVSIALP